MSKGIRSYPIEKQPEVVRRRMTNQTKGNGYWAAQGWTPEKARRP